MTTKKVSICFSTIIGNISNETESKTNITAYRDFFSNLYSNKVPVSMHLTGTFLQMLQNKEEAFYDIIKELVEKKQVELIGGAYYSPLFPVISSVDLVGQIDMYMTAIRKLFSNRRPKAVYLPFSAWNYSVVSDLRKTSVVEYCLLDNRLFTRHDLYPYSPASLENAGKVVTAIPYSYKAEVSESPEAFFTALKNKLDSKKNYNQIVILMPYTVLSKLLVQNNAGESWFGTFINLVKQNETWEITTIVNSLKDQIIFQSGFIEPNIIIDDFVHNVSVKKLISQNPLAYTMYTKIMYVSFLTNQIRGDKQRKIAATQQMWKAQNAMYFLDAAHEPKKNRSLILDFYKNLIIAEKTSRDAKFSELFVPYDFNLDGMQEYISRTKNVNTYVDLKGGKIVEYDFLPANKNYCNLFVRNSGMFVDGFINEAELDSMYNEILPHTLTDEYYQVLKYIAPKKNLNLKGNTCFNNTALSVKKNYSFNGDLLKVQYIIKNDDSKDFTAFFYAALDISLAKVGNRVSSLTVCMQNAKYEANTENAVYKNISWLQINDAEGKSRLTFTPNETVNVCVLPLKESDNLIGIRVYFYWRVALKVNGETEKLISMQAEKIKTKK